MAKKTPHTTLTIFLIKESQNKLKDFLKNYDHLDHFQIGVDKKIGDLYVQQPFPKPPKWGNYFKEYIDPVKLGKSGSTAGVFVIRVEKRWFAITFGQGRWLLIKETWEERFGLIVSLNLIGENKIKSIDKLSFDAISTHARVQSSVEAAAEEFGLDVEQDLVRAVTGSAKDTKLGKRLTGMDALSVNVPVKVEDLPKLLKEYKKQFESKKYLDNFPWIDNISEVKSESKLEELDEKLVEYIKTTNFERCWMAAPEILDWKQIDCFRFGNGSKNPDHYDIHLSDFLKEIRDVESLKVETLKQRVVYCYNCDEKLLEKWPVYKCIYSEVDLDDESYVLCAGKWYCVTRNIVKEVDDFFKAIPIYESDLPEYNDSREGDYNKRVAVANPKQYALMDMDFVRYGGSYDKFEFCDLYSTSKDIIHVKRYGNSSAFSHLFAQGAVSGELFVTQSEIRGIVNEKLPATHKLDEIEKRPDNQEYQVVFAIITDSADNDLMIPFFSRLNLRATVRRLQGYGYRVAMAKVAVNELKAKRKKYK